jgi:thioredoxin 1
MNNRSYVKFAFGLLIVSLLLLGALPSWAGPDKEVPVKGMVTLVDLGANACIPCRLMAPIMTKLEKDYQGKAAVVFIDVWKFPEQAKPFNIQVIPTQIFYDKTGKEVLRHIGFMSEKEIVSQLKRMGVN